MRVHVHGRVYPVPVETISIVILCGAFPRPSGRRSHLKMPPPIKQTYIRVCLNFFETNSKYASEFVPSMFMNRTGPIMLKCCSLIVVQVGESLGIELAVG